MASPKPLEHFMRLNQSVYFHQPSLASQHTSSAPNKSPDLIILCGWMDALPKHISKYASIYENLYPTSRILVITTSSLDPTLRTTFANLNRIKPALEILYSIPPESKKRVLQHFFSNGGGWTSTLIARAYREKMGRALPLSGVIFDSTPGRPEHEATVRAFAVGMPKNPIVRFVALLLLKIFLVLMRMVYTITGTVNLIDRIRMDFNNSKLFATEVPRLYIYNEGDKMVRWNHVEEHAEEAKRLGYKVDLERYKESGHAAHMLNDPPRYWGAVERLCGNSS